MRQRLDRRAGAQGLKNLADIDPRRRQQGFRERDLRGERRGAIKKRIFADAGYQGAKTAKAAAKTGTWRIEIVKRNELHRFVVLPKRWIVQRTLAWISRCRRLAKDFERHARKAAAFIRLAMIRLYAPPTDSTLIVNLKTSRNGSRYSMI